MQALTQIRSVAAALLLLLSTFVAASLVQAQTDPRFGTVGREGAARLNLTWYREYQRQNDEVVLPGKQKHFVVGQITNRSDTLGIDWQWYLLDLLEQPNSLLLQNFLNLVLDLIHSEALPIVRDAWKENRDDLEELWAKTVNGTSKTWSKKVLGVTIYSYTVRLSDTKVSLPEDLPEIQLTVGPDGESILLQVDLDAVWTTHARGSNGSIHATPTFNTKLSLLGTIVFGEDENGRYLAIKEVHGKSVTDAEGDIKFTVNILNIGKVSFTWRKIDILIQTQIDQTIEKNIGKLMEIDQNKDGKPDLAQRFYFESYLSTLFFNGKPLPSQQEILDRIFVKEWSWIRAQIEEREKTGAYWEIGNEPNWFPLMRPEQYAALYTRYYRKIKMLDPSAKCLVGGLFLKEAIDNPRDIVMLMIPDFFSIFREELATFITQSLFTTSTVAWYEAFLAALPPEVKVDVGNFHLYPMRANATAFRLADVQPIIENLAESFKAHGTPEIWITEFGNMDWRRNEQQVADLCGQLSMYFMENKIGITRWFWSRSIGYDRRFDAIGKRPISALLLADGKTLTTTGQVYQFHSDLNERGKVAESDPASPLQSLPLPQKLTLAPSYPNPFSMASSSAARVAALRIPYALPDEGEVRLQIYDVLGRLTREIVNGRQKAGWHEVTWDGRNELSRPVTSGIYFVILRAAEELKTGKIIVTR
ncbi:MAG: glycosyl hydrolase [candidate division KSB1 bacterium]|nr:glycosyl hydrolase [candidate division KSB1 bacterium]MDZ7305411.1 glycosyl hydrolase [candidate division KSB1 bacterium]MDZ7314483.1 glycosyl hydrolase [candidate division KSB1 bacterium]